MPFVLFYQRSIVMCDVFLFVELTQVEWVPPVELVPKLTTNAKPEGVPSIVERQSCVETPTIETKIEGSYNFVETHFQIFKVPVPFKFRFVDLLKKNRMEEITGYKILSRFFIERVRALSVMMASKLFLSIN